MAADSLRPLRANRFDYWKAQHLLNRAGFGGMPSQIRALANMGLEKAIATFVDYEDVSFESVRAGDFDANIMKPATDEERRRARAARQDGDEAALEQLRRERQQRQRADRRQMARIQQQWLEQMIETPRPLEEKMTLFWHGHFATGYRAIEDSYHMAVQNELFRSYATGNFRALAHQIIHDPAMLRYLNNNRNRRQKPNENLARELMELFTLGEGHGYTEKDIKEGARALTGYSFVDDSFVFRPRLHDDREKTILGKSGRWDGDDFVDIILTNRAVSEFICLKLYRYFVNDLPDGPHGAAESFIIGLAKQFRDGGYEVGPLLETLFTSAHFYDESNMAAQIKSPVQLVVQTARSLRTPVRSLPTLVNAVDLMGQNPFYPPSVKGWEGGRSWINTSTLFVRQNLLVYMLTGRRPEGYAWEKDGAPYDASHLVEHLRDADGAVDPRSAIVYLLRFTLGGEAHPERVQTLMSFVEERGGRLDNETLVGVLLLIAAMPEFQLC